MMRLIAVLTLAAFVFVPALPADEGKPCDKDKAGEKGCCPAGQKKGCCPKDADGTKPAPEKAKDKAPESK